MKNSYDDKISCLQVVSKKVPALGIILGMLSGLLLALSVVFAKYVYHVNPFVQLFVRGTLHYASCLIVAIYRREPIIPRTNVKTALLLLANSFLGSMVPIFLYASFKFISVADSIAILFTNPAIVALLSTIFLREKCNIYNVLVVALSVAGCVLVAKPTGLFGGSWDMDSYIYTIYGAILALMSSVSFSLYLLCLRRLSNFAWSTLNVQYGICLSVCSLIAIFAVGNLGLPDCGTDGIVVVINAFLSLGGIAVIVVACKVDIPRNVSVSQTVEIPMVMIFQVLILGTIPGWNSYLGTFLICVSVLLTWGSKWWEARKQKEPRNIKVLNSESATESYV